MEKEKISRHKAKAASKVVAPDFRSDSNQFATAGSQADREAAAERMVAVLNALRDQVAGTHLASGRLATEDALLRRQ